MLKRKDEHRESKHAWVRCDPSPDGRGQDLVQHRFERTSERYTHAACATVVDRKVLFLAVYGVQLVAILAILFRRSCRPASCRPRTRARPSIQYNLAAAAPIGKTHAAQREIEKYFLKTEGKDSDSDSCPSPASRRRRPEYRRGFVALKDWDGAQGRERTARMAIARRATRALGGQMRDVEFYAHGAVRRCAASASRPASRWSCRTRGGLTREEFKAPRDKLLAAARRRPGAGRRSAPTDLQDQSDAEGR